VKWNNNPGDNKMNKKVITIFIVIIVVALVALAMTYAPNMFESMLRFHKIPQH
jgi:flagellar basal body-associated protein FliL